MYLDSANLEDIKKSVELGFITGVTTNPTILKKEKRPRVDQIKDIASTGIKSLFVQLVGSTQEELYSDYQALKTLEKEIGLKIDIKVPIFVEGIKTIKKIRLEDRETKILATAIYTADQGIVATLAGCDYLAPYVNRMQNNSVDPFLEISKMRSFIDDRNLDTEIIAASFKNTSQIVEAMISGAHHCTVSYDLIAALIEKDVALKAIDVFNEDAKSIG